MHKFFYTLLLAIVFGAAWYVYLQLHDDKPGLFNFSNPETVTEPTEEDVAAQYEMVRNIEAVAYDEYRIIDASRHFAQSIDVVKEFKELIANPDYELAKRIRADAVNKLVTVYNIEPTSTVFREIFTGEPNIFSELLADENAEPNQIDASLINLHRYAADLYSTAESEVLLANALFNHNTELYLKLFEACKDIDNVAERGCVHDFDTLLTDDERRLFNEIETEFTERMEAVDRDIEQLKRFGQYGHLARVGIFRSRVLHKSMYFGFTTPREVEAAMQDALVYAEQAGNDDSIFYSRVENAIFLSLLWPDPNSDHVEAIEALLRPIYAGGELAHLQPWYIGSINNTYNEVTSGQYSIRHEMSMRGTLAIANVAPEFKTFLEEEAGWDFEGIAVERIMTNASTQ